MPEIMTAAELARFLKVTPQTIFRWTHNGSIPSMRAGRSLRYDLAEVLRALKSMPDELVDRGQP